MDNIQYTTNKTYCNGSINKLQCINIRNLISKKKLNNS